MKKITLLVVLAISFLGYAFVSTHNEHLAIGQTSEALQFPVTHLNGDETPLNSFAKENGLLIIFSSNTCPFVIAWENRYPALASFCDENKIGFVLLNSNEARRTGEASLSEMNRHAKEMHYDFSYAIDPNSKIANAFGAKATPQVYLFNEKSSLVYRGAIDDNHKDQNAVTHTYAMDALNNLAMGKKISPATTKALGCSIKRVK